MTRQEFSTKIKLAAWKQCGGRCAKCTAKLYPGRFAYDHIRADGLGGNPDISNCQVLCDNCHSDKTHNHDRPIMTKADNQMKAHLGLKPKYRPIPGTRASGWRKPFNRPAEKRT